MHPILRVILVVVGAAFGANLAGGGTHFLAAIVGALAGLAIGEVVFIRNSFSELRAELRELRSLFERGPAEDETTPTEVAPTKTQAAIPKSDWTPVRTGPTAAPRLSSATTGDASGESRPPPSFDWKPAGTRAPARHPAEIAIVRLVHDYFTGGNALVRAGVIVLFFGVAFLLRYLAEHSHIPIEFRLSGIALGAIVLLIFGWRLRSSRRGYALALQGGGVGILYLLVFSALHLYSLLSPTAAFGLLAAVSALSATLAVLQSSLAVALLSVTGGFLAPFLASTGHGDHVALFSYFALLNLVILGIAWFRSWRLLNVAGFAFTFVLSAIWGVLQYQPRDFANSEPFLVAFFLLYVAIAMLYSLRQESEAAPHGYIDATIIFGTPLVAFGFQAAMLHGQRLALAYSALAVSALYIALAWILYRRKGERVKLLVEAFMALGVAFLTLAVPLALNGRWSAASWSLEGAALIWIGCRQSRRAPRAFGAVLQLAAGGALALTVLSEAVVPGGTYIAALMIGIASVYAAQILNAHNAQLQDYEATFSGLLFLWGLLWWCVGGISELRQHLDPMYWLASTLVFLTVSAFLCGLLAAKARLRISLLPTFALLPVMVAFSLWAAGTLNHPLAQGGWIAWPVAFLGLYIVLKQNDQALAATAMNAMHATTLWLLIALTSWELSWHISQAVGDQGAWAIAAWGAVPAAVLAALPVIAARTNWPFQVHRVAYAVLVPAGLALYLASWSIYTDATVASPSDPLLYLPLANPLDLIQALALLVLVHAWTRIRPEQPTALPTVDSRPVVVGLAVIGFLWLNAVLIRSLHLWLGIPYQLDAVMHSTFAQSALSLLWAILALASMLVAARIRTRLMWLTGAALLIIVVIKLFLIDLASVGTVERIVSFVGVGLLMLVVGYFSPLPPAAGQPR